MFWEPTIMSGIQLGEYQKVTIAMTVNDLYMQVRLIF